MQLECQLSEHASASSPTQGDLWGASTAALSFLDWPLRRASGGRLLSASKVCKPGSHAFDPTIASEVWDVSAEFAGLPKEMQL